MYRSIVIQVRSKNVDLILISMTNLEGTPLASAPLTMLFVLITCDPNCPPNKPTPPLFPHPHAKFHMHAARSGSCIVYHCPEHSSLITFARLTGTKRKAVADEPGGIRLEL